MVILNNVDPWINLERSLSINLINAKRVDKVHPWNFFWAINMDGQCLLILKLSQTVSIKRKLPRFNGIQIILTNSNSDNSAVICLKLNDDQHRDIFFRLCLDIIEASYAVRTELEASETFIARTWRWHYLLKGGDNGLLTIEEQKGLIGELLLIEYNLIPSIGAGSAISAWVGPTGSPKDFEHLRIAFEAKARSSSSRPFISISSEYQLDSRETDILFLYVVELDLASKKVVSSFNLNEIAKRIKNNIYRDAPSEVERFDSLLTAAGFLWQDNYSEFNWLLGKQYFFKVSEGFPCLTAAELAPGIERVRYQLSLAHCQPFTVNELYVRKILEDTHK